MSEIDLLNRPPVLIDMGSYLIRIGFAGEDAPRSAFPTIIGHKKEEKPPYSKEYIGEEALLLKSILDIECPIEKGIIKNFKAIEKIWDYIFYTDLRVEPSERPVFLSELPLNTLDERMKIAEIMFEKFEVPGLYFGSQADMSLVSTGRTIGCVVDIGHERGHVVPFWESSIIKEGINVINYGGRDIMEYLGNLLKLKGYSFKTFSEKDALRQMMWAVCYTALHFEEEMASRSLKEFELPDGETVTLDSERFMAPEGFFKPLLMGNPAQSLDDIIIDSISKCEIDIRRDMYVNIVLSGGGTMFSGLPQRLESEIKSKVPSSVRVRVNAPPERPYSTWIGGSIFGSLSSFRKLWITREDYQNRNYDAFEHCGHVFKFIKF